MTFQPTPDGDSRERLIRVEERLKHMDETFGRSLRDLKEAITDLASVSKKDLSALQERTAKLESRVDKIYWVWGAAVFVGTPIMMALTKFLFAKLGL